MTQAARNSRRARRELIQALGAVPQAALESRRLNPELVSLPAPSTSVKLAVEEPREIVGRGGAGGEEAVASHADMLQTCLS